MEDGVKGRKENRLAEKNRRIEAESDKQKWEERGTK